MTSGVPREPSEAKTLRRAAHYFRDMSQETLTRRRVIEILDWMADEASSEAVPPTAPPDADADAGAIERDCAAIQPNLDTAPEGLEGRIADGRVTHGLGESDYFPGNVQHLVSPIVGVLRLRERDGQDVPLSWVIDRLNLVLDLARAEDGPPAGSPVDGPMAATGALTRTTALDAVQPNGDPRA